VEALTGFPGEGIEAGEAGLEEESDSVGGAVTLFGNIESAREPADIGRHRLVLSALFGVPAIFGFVPGRFFA
jgi:hypothetical protein